MTSNKFSPEIEAAILAEVTNPGANILCSKFAPDCLECPYRTILGVGGCGAASLSRLGMRERACDLIKACGLVEAVEDQQSLSLEGCVEHRSGGDVIVGEEVKSCATCRWLDCGVDASICEGCSHTYRNWAPKPEPTKTMTVDEVAEMIERILVDRIPKRTIPRMKAAGVLSWFDGGEKILKDEAKNHACAIAGALVGVKVAK